MPPKILSLHCAVPEHVYRQRDVYQDFFASFFKENPKAEEIFENSRIQKRHAALSVDFYHRERSIEERNRLYVDSALRLGEEAIVSCLRELQAKPADLDDFIVVSCTGYSNPGLEIFLAKRLGMRENIRRTAIGGMGCYAVFPGLIRSCESLVARPEARVLLLSVEICSATFQKDSSTENVVASALFGDGAAALILGAGHPSEPNSSRHFPRLVDFETQTVYRNVDDMGFFITSTGFAIQLSARVPVSIRQNVVAVLERLLVRNGLQREDVMFWIIHPGGAKILDCVQEVMNLSDSEMRFSWEILSEYGNMSSPTVMFILDRVIGRGDPQPGDYGVMMGFGPGLTIESCLVRW